MPRRSFFQLLSCFSTSELEREKLQEFSSAQGQEELYSYCSRPRRTTLEVRLPKSMAEPLCEVYAMDKAPRQRISHYFLAGEFNLLHWWIKTCSKAAWALWWALCCSLRVRGGWWDRVGAQG